MHELTEKMFDALDKDLLKRIEDALPQPMYCGFFGVLDQTITSWLEEKVDRFEDCKYGIVTSEGKRSISDHFGLTKKEWCEHFEWQYSNTACKWRWFYKTKPHAMCMADEWNQCPICGKERPNDA